MKLGKTRTWFLTAALACAIGSQAAEKPAFWVPTSDAGVGQPVWCGMSDNALWAISETGGEDETINEGAILWDIANKSYVSITSPNNNINVRDITNDGKTVVGAVDGKPATYDTQTKEWSVLPGASDYFNNGLVIAVTPDGKYGVGYANPADKWEYVAALWDLTTRKMIELPENAPYLGWDGSDDMAAKITCISPDGRYLGFEISWFYPQTAWTAIYDLQEQKCYPLGRVLNGSRADRDPQFGDLVSVNELHMSNNGRYVTGTAALVQEFADYNVDTTVPVLYDIETKTLTVYSDESSQDTAGMSVTNDGIVLGAQPASNPYREGVVRHGNYFYPLGAIYKQAYDVDYSEELENHPEVSGFPAYISDDCRSMLVYSSIWDNYFVTFPESISEACERVNLLNSYSVTPAANSEFRTLANISLSFDRAIATMRPARYIQVIDEEGNATSASVATASERQLNITFAPYTMEEGKTYTVKIPAGFVAISGDSDMTSNEILITYRGRRDGKVECTGVSPKSGTVLGEFSATTSPVVLTFDCNVAISENLKAGLYRNDSESPICGLILTPNGNSVIVGPTVAQHLYKGYTYTVRIEEGSITDISGAGGCDAIELEYIGAYVNTTGSDGYIWREKFGEGYDSILLYDGDQLQPVAVAQNWGFTAETPWCFVRASEESTDWACAAHSMYTTKGESDDWFTSRQLYIPDANTILRFQAQSYFEDKQDVLRVYVLTTDDFYAYADNAYMNRMKNESDLVFEEILSPGATQEGLDGEWTDYTVDLKKYAGKNIYIGFCNRNTNQSAIFVDNIEVFSDAPFFTSFTNEQYVENLSSIKIRPIVTIGATVSEFSSITATLTDGEGNTVDTFSKTGLNMKEGDDITVEFTKELPLTAGKANRCTVDVTMTDTEGTAITSSVQTMIYNLIFTPEKKIVIEEFSGRTCSNCPLGFVAMANLEKVYGEAIIPVVLRCYEGDPDGNTVINYNTFLGMNAAPSGRINRGTIESPMARVENDYMFSGAAYDSPTWFDYVTEEMKTVPTLEVNGSGTYDEDGFIYGNFFVRAAVDIEQAALGVFGVMVEDQVDTPQMNNLYNTNDDDLLPWSVGGEYAKSIVPSIKLDGVARVALGETFNGSLGSLPNTLKAGETYNAYVKNYMPQVSNMNIDNCKMVLMVIDQASGRVLNANSFKMKPGGAEGVEEINKAVGSIAARDGRIIISGAEGEFVAEAYTLDGSRVAQINGNGEASFEVPAGMIIVRVTSAAGTEVRKFIVR